MKDRIYLISPQFVEEKVQKIFKLPGEIGFISRGGNVNHELYRITKTNTEWQN
jgi:hypothetical protein